MSGRLGPISFKMSDEDPFLGREIHKNRQFSEHTMQVIDDEVTGILQNAARSAFKLLADRRELLDRLAAELIRTEELDQKEIEVVLGPSVHHAADNGKLA
jgi:cell division protease FtsH